MLITINLLRVMESKFPKIKSIKNFKQGAPAVLPPLNNEQELFIKSVNFITPWVGIVLCVVIILDIMKMLNFMIIFYHFWA